MPNPRSHAPFRLLHDFRWMQLGRAGGVEQASFELVAALSHLDRRNAYRIHAPRSACWEWDFPPGFQASRLYSDPEEPVAEGFHRFVAACMAEAAGGDPTRTNAFRAPAGEAFAFDLVHSTCSFIHPELIDFPGVLTIQDLQHLHHPEFFDAEDLANREALYRRSAERARHIICSSEFTRQDVHRRYGVPLDRMTTVWAIPARAAWEPPAAAESNRLLAGMGIEVPFVLYPAQGWPHKNHRRLIEAFARAAPRLPPRFALILTGAPFVATHPATELLARERRVRHLGYRSPLEMRALFAACEALFFPSLFEGFGMPVAEAMIAGKPVACSTAGSLPEVAGDAALLFDPLDVDAIAGALVEIANSATLRDRLSRAARARRRVFSARDSALRTLAIYQRVASDTGRSR